MRDRYHDADEAEKQNLSTTILAAERDIMNLYAEIRSMEKTIRNEEIMFLTK